ncbi:MAG: hydantoinase/oxoprolinase family protein [Planctomycetaceae bacterium]
MPASDLIALDVGGANLKASDGRGWTHAEPFSLWREWRRLPEALVRILDPAAPRRVVATMTGEIADCYTSRAAGVAHIVESLVGAARGRAADVGIYLVDGRIVPPAEAIRRPLLAAASNWHALARLAAAHAPAPRSLLVDVGSTTTDVVALVDGVPVPLERDDAGRMRSGELVYTGIERTPLAAIVRVLPHDGLPRPVAAERFADSRDAWLLLGGLPEDPADHDTADGGPATHAAARVRLARALLVEPDDFSSAAAVAAAERCATVQARRVAAALRRVAACRGWQPDAIVLSGHGEALARRALGLTWPYARVVSLGDILGTAASRVAPAHALALIARGELP